jgi:hypothetical protein
MLAVAVKAREEIIAKLEAVPYPKPGVFVTPVDDLTHKALDPQADTTGRRNSEPRVGPDTLKFLEEQREANQVQLSFFLRAHERHDANLKKNMEFALNCLRKREELDRM